MPPQTEAQRDYQRAYRERNREKIAVYKSAWLKRNRAEATRKKRERRQANPEATNAYERERRARDRARTQRMKRIDHLRRRGGPTDSIYVAALLADPCSYCPAPAQEADHIVPVRDGGASGPENLTAACRSCNRRKSSRSLLHFLAAER